MAFDGRALYKAVDTIPVYLYVATCLVHDRNVHYCPSQRGAKPSA